ncbi:hypothetical protein AMATHDRAFT_3071 [Amanita thiersii Skay4041]|uniref:Uncharacterized protein n=1 Tax=Amanita thiersii Skay4041 TaxID=703135 RepID=A0A2A9NUU7_9AGAR|nr:hypothetical protein AMATHDRAFT_3071 [Amanita thiersii Skay4041]
MKSVSLFLSPWRKRDYQQPSIMNDTTSPTNAAKITSSPPYNHTSGSASSPIHSSVQRQVNQDDPILARKRAKSLEGTAHGPDTQPAFRVSEELFKVTSHGLWINSHSLPRNHVHGPPRSSVKPPAASSVAPPRPRRPPSLNLDLQEPSPVVIIPALPSSSRVILVTTPKVASVYSTKRPTSPARFLSRRSKSVNNLRASINAFTQQEMKLRKSHDGVHSEPSPSPSVSGSGLPVCINPMVNAHPPRVCRTRPSMPHFSEINEALDGKSFHHHHPQSETFLQDTERASDFPLSLFPNPPPLVIRKRTPSPLVLQPSPGVVPLPPSPVTSSRDSTPQLTPTSPRTSSSSSPRQPTTPPKFRLQPTGTPEILSQRTCPPALQSRVRIARSETYTSMELVVSASHRTTASEPSERPKHPSKAVLYPNLSLENNAYLPFPTNDAIPSPQDAPIEWGYAL